MADRTKRKVSSPRESMQFGEFDVAAAAVIAALPHKAKKIQYENTYRMEPKVEFSVDKAQAAIRDILERRLADVVYDADECMNLCKSLSVEIKERVKDMKVNQMK
jgi:hypothetical protein